MAKWADVEKQLIALNQTEVNELKLMAKLLNKIIQRRNELGMTQQELGKRAGFKQTYIARVENGTTIPRLNTLIRLITALDLELLIVQKE